MTIFFSTARRRELGSRLRLLREQSGKNGVDLARTLDWTTTMISRVETGKRQMTHLEVVRYASACGVFDPKRQGELLELVDEQDDYRLKQHDSDVPESLATLMFHEQTAATIENYQPVLLPGVTQTESYIRNLFKITGLIAPENFERYVQLRLERRHVLTRINPVQCTLYISEHAMRIDVGGPKVMQDQMMHLLFVSDRPQCSIRVIPDSAGARGVANAPFTIFGYHEGDPVVYIQHQTTSEFMENRRELDAYRATLKRVASVALTESDSRQLITWLASDYERRATGDGRSGGLAQE